MSSSLASTEKKNGKKRLQHQLMVNDGSKKAFDRLDDQGILNTIDCSDQDGRQTHASEQVHSEVEWLREQVRSLQEYSSHLLQELRQLQQELHEANQEQDLLNREIQRMLRTELLTFDEAKQLATEILAEDLSTLSTREAVVRLLSEIYGRAISFEELNRQDAT